MSKNNKIPVANAVDIENQKKTFETRSTFDFNQPQEISVQSEEPSFMKKCCVCLFTSFSLIFVLAVIFGTLVLYGFNIYSLTLISNKTIHKNCSNSYIWEWMISFVSIALFLGLNSKKKSKEENSEDVIQILLNNICHLVILLSLTGWGINEIWFVDCVNKKMLLYTLSQITVGYLITMYGILFIAITIVCTMMYIETSTAKKTLNNM